MQGSTLQNLQTSVAALLGGEWACLLFLLQLLPPAHWGVMTPSILRMALKSSKSWEKHICSYSRVS